MVDDTEIPELEPYVLSLLVVAAEGAKARSGQSALVRNAALRLGLEWMGDLPAAAADISRTLRDWLGRDDLPDTTFELCAWLIDAIDRLVRERHPVLALDTPCEPTKFDQHVFLAVGQTIANVAPLKRGVGPSATDALRALAKQDPRWLQQQFLRNYIGNVLQDYFDECQIRAEFPTIAAEEEGALRTDDAENLAATVFDALPDAGGPVELVEILQAFGSVVTAVWNAERKLNDD